MKLSYYDPIVIFPYRELTINKQFVKINKKVTQPVRSSKNKLDLRG